MSRPTPPGPRAAAAPSRRYHHGELRAALIAQGMAALAEGPSADISLRALARRAGVSATAVYRHFSGKGALLAALAHEGIERLAADQTQAMRRGGGGLAGFRAMGIAYVDFAVRNPALFRLIFAMAPRVDLLRDDPAQVGTAIRGLRETVAALLPERLSEEHRRAATLRAWALAHGLAMLVLDGQIAADTPLIAHVIGSATLD